MADGGIDPGMADMLDEEADTQKDKFLTFKIGVDDYAITIRSVNEIIGMQKITSVPETFDYIKGVINLRGKVIPIMDVRLRFGMEARDYDERTCIVVIDHRGTLVGLVVDTVSEVVDIPEENIEPSPNLRTSAREHFVEGMGKIGEDIKMVINVDQLLNQDLSTVQEVAVEETVE